MTRRLLCAALLVPLVCAVTATSHAAGATGACAQPASTGAALVQRALRSGQDILGRQLLQRPGGPTYASAQEDLPPLFFAAGPHGRSLTPSRAYYLPFGRPQGPTGRGQIALHVADGSAIVSDRVGGDRLGIGVGPGGREPYGSCLTRLAGPTLSGGYLPILETRYTDEEGVEYDQESFATALPQTTSLVSFLRLRISAPAGAPAETLRLSPSDAHALTLSRNTLRIGRKTSLVFSPGGSFDGAAVRYPVAGTATGPSETIYVARLVRPAASATIRLTAASYARARAGVGRYWKQRLTGGTQIAVPDPYVVDAERNLLIQNLLMSWRYSLGNLYESFEFPESLENAGVMGEYGFPAVERAIVSESFRREPSLYPSWEAATRLQAAARYEELYPERGFLGGRSGALARSASALERQLEGSDELLRQERYTADLPDRGYGLPAATIAWQSLTALSRDWQAAGASTLARTSALAAARLHQGIRSALDRSERTLPDGSLFLPSRLLSQEQPYDTLTASRHGSYWNLVIQDALASGFFAPRRREATGTLAYMERHGSRLLGLTRADAYSLYRSHAPGLTGVDEVYGLNTDRFLADEDQPDQLVLNLYGALAATMTAGTFISGEATSIAPLRNDYYRTTYQPPNSTANAAFLECLRLMLVHETRGADGAPRGLQLAYATPRSWLAAGKTISVRRAATSFGAVSYTIAATASTVRVWIHTPTTRRVRELSLRLRRPQGTAIRSVQVDGRLYRRFDARRDTVRLDGLRGNISLLVRFS